MKKATKTTALTLLTFLIISLTACHEEVVPTALDQEIGIVEDIDEKSDTDERTEDEGEDIRG